MTDRWVDLPELLARLRVVATARGVDQVVLRRPASLAWLLGGRVHVPQTLDTACLDVVIDHASGGSPEITVVTTTIEGPRLHQSEFVGLPAKWVVHPWWESRERFLPSGAGVGSDRPHSGVADLSGPIAVCRRILTERQQQQLAVLGRDAAAAATRAATRLNPNLSEYAAAGVFAQELLTVGLDPVVLMVAGGQRGGAHRHPLPTTDPLGSRAMLVACARRHGLIVSVTRLVTWASISEAERDDYLSLLEVERAFLDATRPGVRLGEVVSQGTAAYGHNGFDQDEWHSHHQGGLSGWVPREFPAHTGSIEALASGMAVAWNPSTPRWKVEDTAVVLPLGPRLTVDDPEWPSLVVGGRRRPDILDLH